MEHWTNVKYIITTHVEDKWPKHNLPEIIIVGKSNVGKSSLINTLGNNKKLARISKTQGKTRALNFFNVNEKFFLVDVPGYGYARTNKKQKEIFATMMDQYLNKRENLKGAIQLIDIRREIDEDDKLMINFFQRRNLPIIFCLTKGDKANQSRRSKVVETMSKELEVDSKMFIITSSFNKKGIDELQNKILELMDGK